MTYLELNKNENVDIKLHMETWCMTKVAFQVGEERIGYSFHGAGQLTFYLGKIYNWSLVSLNTQKINFVKQ